jgi:ParB family chromosome partitioning protein
MTQQAKFPATATIVSLPLSALEESPLNTRRRWNKATLAELAASIDAQGVLVPLKVRPKGKQFEIVMGSRRYRAAKQLKLAELPCMVQEMTDAEVLEQMLVENGQREEVHPMDEARGYHDLLAAGKFDVKTLAAHVGRDVSTVYRRMKLTNLIQPLVKLFEADEIPTAHALALAVLPPAAQKASIERKGEGLFHWQGGVNDLDELERWIQRNVHHALKGAPWKLDDGTMKGGACTACPKRTGAEPTLFGEAKGDTCLDGACFVTKLETFTERRVRELTEKHGACLRVADAFREQVKDKDVLPRGRWFEVKKGTKDAKVAVMMDGPRRGTVLWVTTEVPKARDAGGSDSYQQQERAKRKKALAERAKRTAQAHAILAAVRTSKLAADPKLVRFLAHGVIPELHSDGMKCTLRLLALEAPPATQRVEGVIAKYVDNAKPADALAALVAMLIADETNVQPNFMRDGTRMKAAAALFKVDLAKVQVPDPVQARTARKAATKAKTAPKRVKKIRAKAAR